MDNLNVLIQGDDQVNEEKPPPSRLCPRCHSDNTKFCYYNNYSVSQPRYFCKNCRRYWTHGGALRNIPIGGSCRKPRRSKVDQQTDVSHVSQVVSLDIQQANHHQPYMHVQENEFLGSFGGSSSSVMNHFGSLPDMHGGMITNMTPHQNLPPVNRFGLTDGSFQNYFDVGSNDMIGNPLMNQSLVGHVENHNNFQSFNNTMNMNHNDAGASGSRGSSGIEMNMNNNNNNMITDSCVFRSTYHLEKHGP